MKKGFNATDLMILGDVSNLILDLTGDLEGEFKEATDDEGREPSEEEEVTAAELLEAISHAVEFHVMANPYRRLMCRLISIGHDLKMNIRPNQSHGERQESFKAIHAKLDELEEVVRGGEA